MSGPGNPGAGNGRTGHLAKADERKGQNQAQTNQEMPFFHCAALSGQDFSLFKAKVSVRSKKALIWALHINGDPKEASDGRKE